jgi:hypothetical protein
LNINWVFELVECICKGQIFILHELKVLISKLNKSIKRPLGLASPREKIVQHLSNGLGSQKNDLYVIPMNSN